MPPIVYALANDCHLSDVIPASDSVGGVCLADNVGP